MNKAARDKLRDKAHHFQEWEDYKHLLEVLDYCDKLEEATRNLRDHLEDICYQPIRGDRVADGRIPMELLKAVDEALAEIK